MHPYAQLGLDRSAIPSLIDHTQIFNELLSEIPEIKDVSECISLFWKNHENKGLRSINYSDLVEEPWIKEYSHPSDDCLENQRKNTSKNGILSLNFNPKPELDGSDIPACLDNVTREDMEIVLLGTGSSQPSKYRNVSSIFINLFSKGSLLLDCGEGTLAQLKRRLFNFSTSVFILSISQNVLIFTIVYRFGVEGADNAVKALKCIWISHIHADHHTGLARMLSLRYQLLRDSPHEPLLVIGPRPLKRFLDAYSRLEDLDMLFLDCRHTREDSMDAILNSQDFVEEENRPKGPLETSLFAKGSKMQSYWMRPGSPVETVMPVLRRLKELLCEAGLEALYSVPVVHCPQAFAVVLKAAERINGVGKFIPGWKLVYSGDTRPCQSLVDASRDATVLIHEVSSLRLLLLFSCSFHTKKLWLNVNSSF